MGVLVSALPGVTPRDAPVGSGGLPGMIKLHIIYQTQNIMVFSQLKIPADIALYSPADLFGL